MFLEEYFALPELNAVVEEAIGVMASLGAVIVDPVDTGDPFAFFDDEFTVLLHEFKIDIAAYLRAVRRTRMRTLADLIAFNLENCEAEMTYLDQSVFEASEATSGDPEDPVYLAARANSLALAGDEGIERVMAEHDLDAVLSPSYAFGSSAPAVAGYPSISVPVGIASTGWPAGIWMYARFLEEPKLLAYSYDLEQELQVRVQPGFQGEVPDPPPPLDLCDDPGAASDRQRAPTTSGAARSRLTTDPRLTVPTLLDRSGSPRRTEDDPVGRSVTGHLRGHAGLPRSPQDRDVPARHPRGDRGPLRGRASPFKLGGSCSTTTGPTHVDSFSHLDPDPGAETIDQMPLELFYGPAICLDVSHVPEHTDITAEHLDDALEQSGLTLDRGDLCFFYTGTYDRYRGTPST